jgi:hypothetical protein
MYIKSRLPSSLLVNRVYISLEEVYISKKLSIDYIRVFRLVIYLYISLKLLPIITASLEYLMILISY